MSIIFVNSVHQGFHHVVEIRFSLVRFTIELSPFLFAPARWHRKDEGDMRATFRQLNTLQTHLITESPVTQNLGALFPFISAGHSGLTNGRDFIFRHKSIPPVRREPAPAALFQYRNCFPRTGGQREWLRRVRPGDDGLGKEE